MRQTHPLSRHRSAHTRSFSRSASSIIEPRVQLRSRRRRPERLSSLKFTFCVLPFGPATLGIATDAAFFLAFIHHVVQLFQEVGKILRVALFSSRFRQFSPVICNQGTRH